MHFSKYALNRKYEIYAPLNTLLEIRCAMNRFKIRSIRKNIYKRDKKSLHTFLR